jgi:hypothetical protein
MHNNAVLADGVSTEIALLIACTRSQLDARAVERVRTLAARVRDWASLVELGQRHRLVPLLYTHLTAAAGDLVPDETRRALRDEFAANAATNLALGAELLAIVQLLASRGIDALPYKGPILAQCIYGSLASRQMKDVDILVRPRDVKAVVASLATRGYERVTSALPGARHLGLEHQCVLTRFEDDVIIELHWSVVPRALAPAVTLEDLWPNRLHTSILGRALPSPSHEDTLVVLCIHGAKHQWARLEWVCGVAELIRSKPVDWHKVQDRAKHWHARRMLSTGLLLAAELLEAPVPDAILERVRRDAQAVSLASSVRDRMFADEEAMSDRRVVRSFQLGAQEGLWDRARYRWLRPLIDSARKSARLADWLYGLR